LLNDQSIISLFYLLYLFSHLEWMFLTARAIIASQRLNNRYSALMREPTGLDPFARQYQTVPAPEDKTRPSVQRLFSVREEENLDKKYDPRLRHKSNKSILSRLGSISKEDDLFVAEPTVKDLKRWLIKPVNSDVSWVLLWLIDWLIFNLYTTKNNNNINYAIQ